MGGATGCTVDDVAVCTCLIVVAVANTTATPKAIVSAIKTNLGPILWPPISIFARRIWASGAPKQTLTEPRPRLTIATPNELFPLAKPSGLHPSEQRAQFHIANAYPS